MDLLIGIVFGAALGFLVEWVKRDAGRASLITENSRLKDDIHLSNDAVKRLTGGNNSLLQRCQEKQETINSLMSRVTFQENEIKQHQVSIDTALNGIEVRDVRAKAIDEALARLLAIIDSQKATAAELVAQIEGRCARVRELGEELDEAKVECIALLAERDSALTLLDKFRDSLSSALAKPNLNALAWRKVAKQCLS